MNKCDIVIQETLVTKNEVQLDATTRMNLEHMVSKKKSYPKGVHMIPFICEDQK